ncbi:MAG: winged helix-turn-helix domain-containing protein, partial [Candidatus Promineifilaceae bacterium]
ARVRALLRRSGPAGQAGERPRQVGDLRINPAGREVTVAGRPVSLRAKEFDLLLALAEHLNVVLSREQLLDLVWGYDYYGQTRTVDVHVAHLRERLQGSTAEIETVWGVGYKLVAPA